MDYEIVYLGHDNSNDLILKADEVAQDLSAVTKMALTFYEAGEDSADVTIESENKNGDVILWDQEDYETGEVRLFLGTESIAPGVYKSPLLVYSSDSPEGIVWGYIPIRIIGEVVAED